MDAKIMEIVSANPVTVFGKADSPMCDSAKVIFSELGVTVKAVELDTESDGAEIEAAVFKIATKETLPIVFISGKCVGSINEVMSLHLCGSLVPLLHRTHADSELASA